jgi:hypothetical protein
MEYSQHAQNPNPIFRATSLHGIPSWGFASNSASLRSSSAACSGDKSPVNSSPVPNSRQSCSTSSRFSASGKRRICSRISVLLTRTIYAFGHGAQGRHWRGKRIKMPANGARLYEPQQQPPGRTAKVFLRAWCRSRTAAAHRAALRYSIALPHCHGAWILMRFSCRHRLQFRTHPA